MHSKLNFENEPVTASRRTAWLSVLASATFLFSAVAGCGRNGSEADFSSQPAAGSSSRETFVVESAVDAPVSTAAPDDSSMPAGFGASEASAESASPVRRSDHKSSRSVKKETISEGKDEIEPNSGRQSGILTAGSFDDVANFGDYLAFLRRRQHQANQCQLPLNMQSRQTLISVRDSDGKPLGNVRCVVRQPGSDQVLLDRKTGTDGRVMLLTDAALHHPQQSTSLRLQVFDGDQQNAVSDQVLEIARRWTVTVDNVPSNLPAQLDLALVVDTTGSMGDELEYLKTEIDSIVASVHRMFPDVDQKYSLVTYRDNGDQYVCRTFDFTGSLSDFRRSLDAQSAGGGGDFPEAMDVALNAAGQLSWRGGNTARVLFLVGDAPPHTQNLPKALHAVSNLSKQGVRVFPVGASGVEATAEVLMRTASLLTMGQYLFLTDHSGVGNPHATPDVPEFAVERLDRLMIRMIASELAGKRLAAEEVIAIEHGELYSFAQPACTEDVSVSQSPPTVIDYCCGPVERPSTFRMLIAWIGQHALATAVALVAGIVVFDRLTKFCPMK